MVGVCRKCDDCWKVWCWKWIGWLMVEYYDSLVMWFVMLIYGGGYENVVVYWINCKDMEWFFVWVWKWYCFKLVMVSEFGG